jgi:hypothetical protein
MKFQSIMDMLQSQSNEDLDLAFNILYNHRYELGRYITYRQGKILHLELIKTLTRYKVKDESMNLSSNRNRATYPYYGPVVKETDKATYHKRKIHSKIARLTEIIYEIDQKSEVQP